MRAKGNMHGIASETGGHSDRKLDMCIFDAVQNLGNMGDYSMYNPVNLKPANVKRSLNSVENARG